MASTRLLLCSVLALSVTGCWSQLFFKKCCGVYEMLDTRGLECVPSPWPQHRDLIEDPKEWHRWVTKWLPPGLLQRDMPIYNHSISLHYHRKRNGTVYLDLMQSIVRMELWNGKNLNRSHENIMVLAGDFIVRPSPDGGFRLADYCVDAAQSPFGPFALRFRTKIINRRPFDSAPKCCPRGMMLGHLLKDPDVCRTSHRLCNIPRCVADPDALWSASNSSTFSHIDPELPYQDFGDRIPFDAVLVDTSTRDVNFWASFARTWVAEMLFSTWLDGCFDLHRGRDGVVREVAAVKSYARPTRGAYWLASYLSWGAILLLLAALAAVVGNERTRTTPHGWALVSHGGCLLLFNVTQVAFTWSISDAVVSVHEVPEDLEGACLAFAFIAYFLQTGASCWLTAICINMARGFRVSARPTSGSSPRRIFAWMAGAAWGATVALTAICGVAFAASPLPARGEEPVDLPWYRPSLLETRTCYLDFKARVLVKDRTLSTPMSKSVKWGTLLYFYAPMFALVIANVVALGVTAWRIHYLRRGSAFLRADKERDGDTKSAASDIQSLLVYLKLLLSAGSVEILTEAVPWVLLSSDVGQYIRAIDNFGFFVYRFDDHTYVHRAAGFCADFLRALIVLWLCAPERGALSAAWRRAREKSAR